MNWSITGVRKAIIFHFLCILAWKDLSCPGSLLLMAPLRVAILYLVSRCLLDFSHNFQGKDKNTLKMNCAPILRILVLPPRSYLGDILVFYFFEETP